VLRGQQFDFCYVWNVKRDVSRKTNSSIFVHNAKIYGACVKLEIVFYTVAVAANCFTGNPVSFDSNVGGGIQFILLGALRNTGMTEYLCLCRH
jgi:hypothetical protein